MRGRVAPLHSMSALQRYATAGLILMASVALGLVLQRWLGAAFPVVPFLPAIVPVAWLAHRLHRAEDDGQAAARHHRDRTLELQTILDTAVDGIIVIDARGLVESFNRGAEHLFGYPAAEVIGRNVSMLMP